MPERSPGGEESSPLGGEIIGGAMISDAAERDVHIFIEELTRRVSLQEKAAEEKQKETEPIRGDICQNDDGAWQVQFRGANRSPFRRGQRVKLGRNRDTPLEELVPWKPM